MGPAHIKLSISYAAGGGWNCDLAPGDNIHVASIEGEAEVTGADPRPEIAMVEWALL